MSKIIIASFLLALAQAYLVTGTLDRKNTKIDFS
jgi:hypothetical protein